MTRRLLIALCLLAVPLAAAPSAEAAKRGVPRGFFGAIFDGPIKDAAAHPRHAGVRPHGLVGRRIRSHQLLLGRGAARSRASPTFARTDAIVREAAAHGQLLLPVVTAAPRLGPPVPGQGRARRRSAWPTTPPT